MKVNLPIKIHNKFEIEVKDVTTGEIVQKGYAENIVLDSYFTSTRVHSELSDSWAYYVGYGISFGSGDGELSPSRVELFNFLGSENASSYELVINQVPLPSYATKFIKILPAEHIGEIITEVGINMSPKTQPFYAKNIFTHALIKDSAGNPLTLGPKTSTQEITIYSTIYFVPDFEPGITLSPINNNSVVIGFVGHDISYLRSDKDNGPRLSINGIRGTRSIPFMQNGFGKLSASTRLETAESNEKIKMVGSATRSIVFLGFFSIDLLTLAENNSSIWSGWEFDKTPIGVGDGATTEFPLPWDEAWLDKPKTIYVDGVATAVTWTEDTITFATAPVDQAPITGSYWVKYVPKDENHVLDITFDINYAEGVTT